MKIGFEEEGDFVIYRVADFDPKHEPMLQACYYQHDDRGYFKKYPRTTPHIAHMMANFGRCAELMFDQLGYFAEAPWQDALHNFCMHMQDSGIEWWLTGSCAACVRGIAFSPHDIDIMFNAKDAAALTEHVRDFLIEPILDTGGWVTKDFGVMFTNMRIDLASDPSPMLDEPEPVDCGPYALAHLETLVWDGFTLRVPPVALLRNANRRRERWDRVALIDAYLADHAQAGASA